MPFQEIVKFLSSENCENLENFEEFKSDFDDSISKEHDIYVIIINLHWKVLRDQIRSNL
jgi:hypothetical protein